MLQAIAENVSAIVSAIGTMLAAWFAYNQYTKNKLTDMKIEKFKQEEEQKSLRRADNSSLVFGELWDILHELGADRVYIIQPHPLGSESFVSVYYEVKRKGVEPMKPHIQNLKISEVAKFARDMVKQDFMYFSDVHNDVSDKYARAILSSYGCCSAMVKRMNDNTYDWVGSIFCEFTRPMEFCKEDAEEALRKAAMNIQYLIPEFR